MIEEKKIKIVGMGLTTKGEARRYMRRTMDEFKRLCDDVIICCNNASDEERNLIDEYGFKHYDDDREWGVEQPNLKTDLLHKVAELNPDWVIPLDMDEVFAPEFTREEAERLASGDEIAWYFLVVNLYNDEQHFAHSKGIQRFWNIRYFKLMTEHGLQYLKKNLHCGLAPPIAYRYGWHAPYYLLHYGLMLKEDRLRKAMRYDTYDPTRKFKAGEYYDELITDLPMIPFDSEGLLRKLKEAPDTQPRKMPRICE